MASRLVNVRLDDERVRKVQALRARGVALADLVREAIDARFDALRRTGSRTEITAIIRDVFEQHPDPPGLPVRGYDVHNSRAARTAIAARLRRRR